jgi:hypothetical protein
MFRCKACGWIHDGEVPPDRCVSCGATADRFRPMDLAEVNADQVLADTRRVDRRAVTIGAAEA